MSDTQKHTKPNVPNLRFPGFEGEWAKVTIGRLCNIVGGGTPDTSIKEYWNGEIQWFTPSEVGKEKYVSDSIRTISVEGLKNSSAKLLPPYSILLSSRATVGECSINLKECCTNQGFQSAIPNMDITSTEFLYYRLITHKQEFIKKACGSTFLEISAKQIFKLNTFIPAKSEQEKIAALLSMIDERISIQIKVIERYQSLIRALIQKAKSESTICVQLRDILTERKELNSQCFDICSVSVSKGIVNQVEYLGRSFAAKDTSNYHVVRFGDIVYTKSPTGDFPYGIIKQSNIKSPVAVSPLYGIYEPKSFVIGKYLHYYFCSPENTLNYLHPLIQKGAKNTINITNLHFLDNKVSIPNKAILETTVVAITSLASRCDLEEDALCRYLKQKEFLLKNLFM